MELAFFPDLLFLIAILWIIFLLLKISKHSKNPRILLPPGPPKLPLLGNIHHLATSPSPHQRLRDLANKYGPIMHLQLGEASTIVISSPDAAKQVFKEHGVVFADRPKYTAVAILTYGCRDIAFAPYGNQWRQARKVCVEELFTVNQVRSFRSFRGEEALALVKSIAREAGSAVNLTDKIFSLTMGITTRAAFGKRSDEKEKVVSLLTEASVIGSGFCLADLFPGIDPQR